MLLFFANRDLQRRCTMKAAGDLAWGSHAPIIRRRLIQLDAAAQLTDLLAFPPGLRPVVHTADWRGEVRIPAGAAMEIVAIAVTDDDGPVSGRYSPANTTALRIVAVEQRDAQ